MTKTVPKPGALDRLSSHVAGLDTVLGGGFFNAGVYIVQGSPGSGKTIFANQLCYGHVANGGKAVYVTLLAESHARMLQHLRGLDFFDESVIPQKLSYISAFHDLEANGLKGLMSVLLREMRARATSVLVLDGLVAAAETATSDRDLKKFIHEVQTSAVFHGCTVFMLTSGGIRERVSAEHTMVDGLLEFEESLFSARAERSLNVRKFRGSASLRGQHTFTISNAGLTVYPRLESLYLEPPTASESTAGVTTGASGLDRLLSIGGLPSNSATVVIGSTGTGKTSISVQFLSQSSVDEPGLFFGFFESPDRIRSRAASMGTDLRKLEASGAVQILWHPNAEIGMDQLAHELLDAVRAGSIKRVVIDGLSGFFEAATDTQRVGRFFSCLSNELRRLGVTLLTTLETRDAVGSVVPTPYGISAMVDNLVFLRFAEVNGEIKRLISILKVRSSDFDPGVHAYEITAKGVRVDGRFTLGGDVIPEAEPVSGRAGGHGPSPAT